MCNVRAANRVRLTTNGASCTISGVLTRPADLAERPGVFSRWPPSESVHRPHNSATPTELGWRPAVADESYASDAVVVALSMQNRFLKCPKI